MAQRGLGAALLLTAGSALLPGLAHLRGGRRGIGAFLLTTSLLCAVVLAVFGSQLSRDDAIRLVVQQRVLTAVMAGAVFFALVWCMLLVSSYRAVRPWYLGRGAAVAGRVGVVTLCLAVVAPLAFAARYAYIEHDLIGSVFAKDDPAFAHGGKDFWAKKPRLNILLLGGDAGPDRKGVRTDSMILASIDTHTGATVLLALPRNLQKAQMPPGPAQDRFPNGFTGDGAPGNELLNAVWKYGEDHPDIVPGSDDPGPDLLKGTIGATLGQKVDYYILVNLFGFRDIVQALGGIKIRITEPIPYGLQGRVLQPGLRKLNGSQALWYARSRTGSSDYQRMDRQRCVIGAIARQASPQTVLTRFQQIASATKKVVSTDLPASLLPHLVTLAGKAKTARIDSVTFTPPLITPARPDFDEIHEIAAEAIAASKNNPSKDSTSTLAASAKKQEKQSGTGGTSTRRKKSSTSTSARSSSEKPAVGVDQACQYS